MQVNFTIRGTVGVPDEGTRDRELILKEMWAEDPDGMQNLREEFEQADPEMYKVCLAGKMAEYIYLMAQTGEMDELVELQDFEYEVQ